MEMEISKTFTFEASHILPKHKGKCSRLHGHSWVLTVYVKGEVNSETGFVLDFGVLKDFVNAVVEALDHHHLGVWTDLFFKPMLARHRHNLVSNMPEDFYPSSENLIIWIGDQLSTMSYVDFGIKHLPWSKLELNETCTSKCVLTREAYDTTIRNTVDKGATRPVGSE